MPLLSASTSCCVSNQHLRNRQTSSRAFLHGSRWSAHKRLRRTVWGRVQSRAHSGFTSQGTGEVDSFGSRREAGALTQCSGVQVAGQVQATNSASVFQPASISRVFIGVQPGRGATRLPKAGKPSGPMSLVCLKPSGQLVLSGADMFETPECCSFTGAATVYSCWNHLSCSSIALRDSC